jgi:hypothetical protein
MRSGLDVRSPGAVRTGEQGEERGDGNDDTPSEPQDRQLAASGCGVRGSAANAEHLARLLDGQGRAVSDAVEGDRCERHGSARREGDGREELVQVARVDADEAWADAVRGQPPAGDPAADGLCGDAEVSGGLSDGQLGGGVDGRAYGNVRHEGVSE